MSVWSLVIQQGCSLLGKLPDRVCQFLRQPNVNLVRNLGLLDIQGLMSDFDQLTLSIKTEEPLFGLQVKRLNRIVCANDFLLLFLQKN